ncbi:AIPR family protein, partial [Roseburia faecis]|nr:AIPR family protein [Roseburia faecis]
HYGLMSEPYQAFYGQISGDQVVDWWRAHGTKLFSKNIRNILGSTEVNESIKATAITNPELFWYFNNGVTLLVSEIEPHRRNSN